MSKLERIVAAMGGVTLDNGRRALIRGPDHGPHDRSVSLYETEDGRILIKYFSPRDDWRDVQAALAARGLLDAPAPEPAEPPSPSLQRAPAPANQQGRIARARRLWDEGRAITGAIAERYLLGRAISLGALNSDARRFHPCMTSLENRNQYPALLAANTDNDGALIGVQATLLSSHGAAKAALATPRRVIGRLIGGAVRLHSLGRTLIAAEGVETALSASEALFAPAWALLSAENLSRFTPPPGVNRLIVAADDDAAGGYATERLIARLGADIVVETAASGAGYNDWNDWARAIRR